MRETDFMYESKRVETKACSEQESYLNRFKSVAIPFILKPPRCFRSDGKNKRTALGLRNTTHIKNINNVKLKI